MNSIQEIPISNSEWIEVEPKQIFRFEVKHMAFFCFAIVTLFLWIHSSFAFMKGDYSQ